MHDTTRLLLRCEPVEQRTWDSLWDHLDDGAVDRGEAMALLASLATCLPGDATLAALVASLRGRRTDVPDRWAGTVNVVGTGGGPRTFNISTAAAFVAASTGVRVVKSGSRAVTGLVGSVDLLDRLGVGLAKSYDDIAEQVDRHGVAFAGPFVYPGALARLARIVGSPGMRPFGRFLNAVGPFVAVLPVAAQVTGVSGTAPLPELQSLAASVTDRRIWLCGNDLGADELLGCTGNWIMPNDGPAFAVAPVGPGSLADLAPVAEPGLAAGHFLELLAGDGGAVATRTVCLNAAALAVAGGYANDWHEALADAEHAVHTGAARTLVDRLRTERAAARV